MFEAGDRLVLLRWCRTHRVPWSDAAAPAGGAAIVLHAVPGRMTLRLVSEASGVRLETIGGETLAAASGVQALLDAVDAGIASVPQPMGAQHSATTRNIAGSAIT